jgi:GTP-binding protein EngB required for normal cell division
MSDSIGIKRMFAVKKSKSFFQRFASGTIHSSSIATLHSSALDTSKLFVAISELDEKYNIKLKSFPSVVVVGSQSSGKSSVIEAICGQSILPKAMKMATLKPIHLTTIRSDQTKFKIGDHEFLSSIEASNEIDRLNNNTHVTKVNVTIYSPDVYNASLIDLPGLFVVASDNAIDLPKKVKDLNINYLQDPHNIPVLVHAGPSDPATDQAIKLVGKMSRNPDCLGVITKIDMLERQKMTFIEEMLEGKTCPLGHGYVCCVLRNDRDIEEGKSISAKMLEETEFFTKVGLKPSGVIQLRKIISDIQFSKIGNRIPDLVSDIDMQISNLKTSQTFMSNLINNDQKTLASKLRMMIEKLVGSSLERAEFEDKLKQNFKVMIGSYLEETFDKNTKHPYVFSQKRMNERIFHYNNKHKSNPTNYQIDGIKELFSYGLVSPIPIDNLTIRQSFRKEKQLALAMPMIELFIDDPLGKKRLQWNKYLNAYFSRLLSDDNIHNIVHDITEKLLLEYIYNDVEGCDDLTKKFAEYMIKEIGNSAFESKIKYSITATLNLEKRPHISIFEVIRYIAQMYPKHFTFQGRYFEWLDRTNSTQKLRVEVYSAEWNEAYLRVVGDNLTENCYRNVAVNLLDRMVEKLLELCMDLFNRENAIKEQNKINSKIIKLGEIRQIIASYTKNAILKEMTEDHDKEYYNKYQDEKFSGYSTKSEQPLVRKNPARPSDKRRPSYRE